MSINLYDTHTMLSLQEVIKPKSTFLRDRYFPTASEDIFDTEDVIVDFKDEAAQTLAPVVTPNKGGIAVAREGYQTHTYTPPLVAPERTLTANQLLKRQAGENIVSDVTPQQREAKILTNDLSDLSAMIDLREEYMAAQVLLNNGYTLKQYADNYGDASDYVEMNINFYTGSSNPATYVSTTKWDATGHDILADIAAMADKLTKRGLPATDLIVGSKVADVLLSDETILKLLDNRRFILAQEVNPQEQASGSVLIAVLNVKGHLINVYSYTRQYRSEGKTSGNYTMEDFIPAKMAVVTAPGMGRTAYGAIVQMDEGAETFTTYANSRVPQVITNSHDNTKTIIQRSRPIVMPKVLNSAISAQVLS